MAAGIRVLVADVPPLLHDILVNTLSTQPDFQVMTTPAASTPRERRGQVAPAVIVCGDGPGTRCDPVRWLNRWPQARVIVVETNARRSTLVELRPLASSLGELSPEQLVTTIRSAARADGPMQLRGNRS